MLALNITASIVVVLASRSNDWPYCPVGYQYDGKVLHLLVPHNHMNVRGSTNVRLSNNANTTLNPDNGDRKTFNNKNPFVVQHIRYPLIRTSPLYASRQHCDPIFLKQYILITSLTTFSASWAVKNLEILFASHNNKLYLQSINVYMFLLIFAKPKTKALVLIIYSLSLQFHFYSS